jgi:hypothetical protein
MPDRKKIKKPPATDVVKPSQPSPQLPTSPASTIGIEPPSDVESLPPPPPDYPEWLPLPPPPPRDDDELPLPPPRDYYYDDELPLPPPPPRDDDELPLPPPPPRDDDELPLPPPPPRDGRKVTFNPEIQYKEIPTPEGVKSREGMTPEVQRAKFGAAYKERNHKLGNIDKHGHQIKEPLPSDPVERKKAIEGINRRAQDRIDTRLAEIESGVDPRLQHAQEKARAHALIEPGPGVAESHGASVHAKLDAIRESDKHAEQVPPKISKAEKIVDKKAFRAELDSLVEVVKGEEERAERKAEAPKPLKASAPSVDDLGVAFEKRANSDSNRADAKARHDGPRGA